MKAKRKTSVTKIAVSLPHSLFRALEHLRNGTGETRSAFVQRLIREKLAEEERVVRIRRYQEAYRRRPESPDEIAAAEASARALLGGEPWE